MVTVIPHIISHYIKISIFFFFFFFFLLVGPPMFTDPTLSTAPLPHLVADTGCENKNKGGTKGKN